MTRWSGKRVFVTGHSGFKGSWLSLWLEALGAHVTGFSLPPLPRSLYEAAELGGHFVETLADIGDADAIGNAISLAAPEVVFHLAAQPLVSESFADPARTFRTNTLGTVNLLEALRHCPSIRAVVVVTTDKVYRGVDARAFQEADALGGDDPYSASKAASEIVCNAYRESFFSRAGVLLATARAGNVIGGGDWASNRLLTDLIEAARAGRPAIVRSPASVRPWQHVLDVLQGYIVLAERLLDGDHHFATAWNLAPPPTDAPLTVAAIADLVTAAWGGKASWHPGGSAAFREKDVLLLDSTRALRDLGWRPKLTVNRAVDWTVAWHRTHLESGDARTITMRQIEGYTTDQGRDVG